MKTIRERFEEKFTPEPNSGCWLWIGAYGSRHGEYGIFFFVNRRDKQLAHRAAWWIYKGTIPPGLQVNHKCNNSYCVNPEHLYLGTQQQNVADAVACGVYSRCRQGERSATHKLSLAQVKLIRASKDSSIELGRLYKVSRETIWSVRAGKSWKHVL